jgi:hypothetical protein
LFRRARRLFPRRCWVTSARKQAAWSLTQVEKASLLVEPPAQPQVLTPLTHCYRAKSLEKSRRALGKTPIIKEHLRSRVLIPAPHHNLRLSLAGAGKKPKPRITRIALMGRTALEAVLSESSAESAVKKKEIDWLRMSSCRGRGKSGERTRLACSLRRLAAAR